ncbi:protein NRT1/ PTR FAMILY 4.5-like [Asparagus officinalis]|uniref:protein NRT1/ PTR FAMILY 4.5-like n=1 Tax=Asparagus officinalis TaxID=4686 RepID=UPI00098E6D18|nr:protein NRT1/ PTR FAMILY 4.5-like [Asparagus officinalis]
MVICRMFWKLQEEKGEILEGKVDWKGRAARKGVHGGFRSSLLVLGLFGFDSFATTSLAVSLVTYFIGVMHFDIARASNEVTNFMGTSYILSVFLSYIADTVMGRYKIALMSAIIEFLGLVLLTVQAHLPSLKPPGCILFSPTCEKIVGGNAVLMYTALYLIAVGMAGVKAGVPSHGADQFDENDPEEVLSMSSFFNWILLSACVGAAFSVTFVVWIQDKSGFDWGYGVCTIGILLGVIVFVAGVPRYRIHVIGGASPLTEIIQVYVASIRNRKLQVPTNPEELYEISQDKESAVDVEFMPHRDMYRFLDKAAIRTTTQDEDPNGWKLCTVTQVEKAKTILAMIPIFGSAIIMSTCLAQLQTFSIQQGVTMDRHIGSFKIPSASLIIIPLLFLLIIVPIYDRLIVPILRKFTGHSTGITHLQRVGVGLVLSCISMTVAAVVEVQRKKAAERNGMIDAIPELQQIPMSAFWLSFQFFIFGIADMFTFVGLLEFFHSEAPKELKSVATSFLWLSMGLGYFVSSILVDLVNLATKGNTKSGGWLNGNNLNRNHLNLFYLLLAVLSFFNLLNYLFWARSYRYRTQKSVGL